MSNDTIVLTHKGSITITVSNPVELEDGSTVVKDTVIDITIDAFLEPREIVNALGAAADVAVRATTERS